VVRKVTPGRLQSIIRQAAQKQQRAIDDYNRAVRQHNAQARQQQSRYRQAVSNYNREVRAFNARVAANQRRLRADLVRLSRTRIVATSVTYYRSVTTLHDSYETVESSAPGTWLEHREDILDLAQQETSRSLAIAQAAEADGAEPIPDANQVDPRIDGLLRSISPELGDRWQGAIFAVSPRNPDAARHFSTSSREILATIIEREATDDEVFAADPLAQRGSDGRPTRRARLAFCLARAGRASDPLAAFADADVGNVIELFRVFNDGTHGSAGIYDLGYLRLIRERVEGAIEFLHSILR
jgi:hypothetical protein